MCNDNGNFDMCAPILSLCTVQWVQPEGRRFINSLYHYNICGTGIKSESWQVKNHTKNASKYHLNCFLRAIWILKSGCSLESPIHVMTFITITWSARQRLIPVVPADSVHTPGTRCTVGHSRPLGFEPDVSVLLLNADCLHVAPVVVRHEQTGDVKSSILWPLDTQNFKEIELYHLQCRTVSFTIIVWMKDDLVNRHPVNGRGKGGGARRQS